MTRILLLSIILFNSCAPVIHQFIPTLRKKRQGLEHKICFVGDTGTGSRYQYLVAEKLLEEDCDQLRILGDVIYEFGLTSPDDPEFFEKFYKPYQDIMARKTPIYIIMGNHDFRGSHRSWLEIAKKYPYINFPNYYYDEIWDGVCFFSLDTNIYASKEQKSWLKKALEKQKNECLFSIAMGHHPYRSSGSHGDASGGRAKFLEKIVGRVDLYIAGHDHNLADEGEVSGTRLLISGAGAKIRPVDKRKQADFVAPRLGYATLIIKKENDRLAGYYIFKTIEDRKAVFQHWGRINPQGIR